MTTSPLEQPQFPFFHVPTGDCVGDWLVDLDRFGITLQFGGTFFAVLKVCGDDRKQPIRYNPPNREEVRKDLLKQMEDNTITRDRKTWHCGIILRLQGVCLQYSHMSTQIEL